MPPFVLTYGTLTTLLGSYLENTNTAVLGNIPVFIANCEFRLSRELRTLMQQANDTGNFVVGAGGAGAAVQKPTNWRETISWNYGTGATQQTRNNLLLRTYEFCRAYWPDPTVLGAPIYYADWNLENFLVVPTPDQAYPWELVFYQRVPPLCAETQTNFFTQYAPDLVLYGSLLETAPFLKNDERIPTWQDRFDRALKSAIGEDERRLLDRTQTAKESTR